MKQFLSAVGSIIVIICVLGCPITTDGGSNINLGTINPPVTVSTPPGIISGRITSDSSPGTLAEPIVALYWRDSNAVCPTGIEPVLNETSLGWNFTFSDVPSPASYYITVSADKHQNATTGEFMLPESDGKSDVNITLVKDWKVGTVAAYSGAEYATSVLAGIAIDKFGNIFVADYGANKIQKIDNGSSVPGVFADSTASGPDTITFNTPQAIVVDDRSTPSVFYVTDSLNHRIMKIEIDPANSTKIMSVLAGTGSEGAINGTGAAASFKTPSGLVRDGDTLYVADTGNNKIRTVDIDTGIVGALMLTGRQLDKPSGLALDGNGYLYAAELDGNCISKIKLSTGKVERVFGTGEGSYVDSKYFFRAKFNQPAGLVYYGRSLFVADMENYCVRRINLDTGVVSTLAGNQAEAGFENGIGTAAKFTRPIGIAVYNGDVYVTDAFSPEAPFLVRKLTANYQ